MAEEQREVVFFAGCRPLGPRVPFQGSVLSTDRWQRRFDNRR